MITFLGPVTSHQESCERCGVSQQDGINKKSGIGCVCQFHRGSISMEIGAVICGFARFAVLQLLKKTLCSIRFALRPVCPAFDNEVRVTAKRGGGEREEDNDAARFWADKRINPGVYTLGIKRGNLWLLFRADRSDRLQATLTERRSVPSFSRVLGAFPVHSSRLRKRIEKLNRRGAARFFASTFFRLFYFFFFFPKNRKENVCLKEFLTYEDRLLNRIAFENSNNTARTIA